jgi:glycosyltransferase involved in cell wall biosynthesis
MLGHGHHSCCDADRSVSRRVLWVTDEVPDADLGGGSIRQHHILTRLAAATNVDLLLVGTLVDDSLRRCLNKVIEVDRPAPVNPLTSWVVGRQAALPMTPPSEIAAARPVVEAARRAASKLGSYDLVQVEHEWLAPLRPRRPREAWAITLHNLLSVRTRQQAVLADSARVRWLLERDADHASAFERRITERYEVTMVVSEDDAAALDGGAVVVPNGVDLEKFAPTPLPAVPSLLFTASWKWPPNVEAAFWLCRNILPLVRAEVPDATVTLVGRWPDRQLHDLASDLGVETHFDVPSVVPYLNACRVAVVPVRVGSGTRLKALEAMAGGRPIAGTTIGLEGLGLVDGVSAAFGDDAERLANQIVRLLRDDEYATALSRAARNLAESRFSWDSVAQIYLDSVLAASHVR